jgi:hypothetical protein
MESFYTITMNTQNGKTLYLSMWDDKPKWTFDINEACYWNTEDTALKFANKWFKNFNDWSVKEITVNVNKIS